MTKKGVTNKILSASLLIFCAMIIPHTTRAEVVVQQLAVDYVNDFVVEPSKNEVILDPGSAAQKIISVTNRMNKNVTFTIDIEDIVGSDNSFEQVKLLGNEKSPYSLKDFLIPEILEFTLSPGEKISIPISVELPIDAEPRGYYGAVIISAKSSESQTDEDADVGGVTKLVTRVGSIFLVKINGDVNEQSSLWDFKAIGPEKMFYSKHPEGFEVAIKNDGNVHLVHYGEVEVKNIFGKVIASMPLNAFFSLPDSTRYRELEWPQSFSFGYYRAELNLYQGYGDDYGFIDSTLSFFVIPWTIFTGLILLALMIFGIIRFIMNNFKIERK